jgi:hypothetical protein
MYLQHVRGEKLNELIDDVLQDLTGPLQGRVAITPLGSSPRRGCSSAGVKLCRLPKNRSSGWMNL